MHRFETVKINKKKLLCFIAVVFIASLIIIPIVKNIAATQPESEVIGYVPKVEKIPDYENNFVVSTEMVSGLNYSGKSFPNRSLALIDGVRKIDKEMNYSIEKIIPFEENGTIQCLLVEAYKRSKYDDPENDPSFIKW